MDYAGFNAAWWAKDVDENNKIFSKAKNGWFPEGVCFLYPKNHGDLKSLVETAESFTPPFWRVDNR